MKLESLVAPLIAALVFALHPINSEAVIWVAGRADLMATTFILLTAYAALRYFEARSLFWLFTLSVMFFLGCLAKETALFIWPGLVLMGWLIIRRDGIQTRFPDARAFLPALVCLPAIAAYFLSRWFVLQGRDLGIRHLGKVLQVNDAKPTASLEVVGTGDLMGVLHTSLVTAGFYAKKMFLPFPLNFGIIHVADAYFWLGLLLLVLVVVLVLRPSWPGILLLTAMSLASIALLVAMGGVSWTPIGERYMYAPCAFLSIALTLGAARYFMKVSYAWRRIVQVCVLALLVTGALSSFQRSLVWSDNLVLMRDTAEKSPEFAMAQNLLAVELYQNGGKAQALEIFNEIEVPVVQPASLNKFFVLIEEERYPEAEDFLQGRLANPATVNYRPKILKHLLSLAELRSNKCPDQACRDRYLEKSLALVQQLYDHTKDPFYHYRIGQLHLALGDQISAQSSFASAYAELPESSLYSAPAGKLANKLKHGN